MFRVKIFTLFALALLAARAGSFEDMVKTYASTPIEYPALKPVTLAMMILESGRGTSGLAKKYKNYAGLKYREQISNYAYKVRYEASDGFDDYSAFKTDKDFIHGFWAFLDRLPYKGWRGVAHSPQAFLEKISPVYCPYNKDYASRVLSLLPEANALLAKYGAGDLGQDPSAPKIQRVALASGVQDLGKPAQDLSGGKDLSAQDPSRAKDSSAGAGSQAGADLSAGAVANQSAQTPPNKARAQKGGFKFVLLD
ncbi:MAG: glucosaminidase domain-containing protein [Helicobacteraceae bacterium]